MINEIDRFCEPPEEGLMSDILWSDPQPEKGRSVSKRGNVACQWGPDITEEFLMQNKLKYIIRSHEMVNEGYEINHNGKVITVFSAPNYCDRMGNKGAFIRYNKNTIEYPEFVQFTESPHPPVQGLQFASPLLRFAM